MIAILHSEYFALSSIPVFLAFFLFFSKVYETGVCKMKNPIENEMKTPKLGKSVLRRN